MKRLFAALLALVMTFTVICVGAEAAAPKLSISLTYGSGYTYATISKSGTVYYTTDGSKPTNKSRKYTGKIKITSPCKLRAALYVKGKRVKAVIKTVNVKMATPTVTLTKQESTYAEYSVNKTLGSQVYYTTDGSTPSETNGKMLTGNAIVIAENCTLKLVCVRNGWKNSSVKTVKISGLLTPDQYAEEVVRLVNIERENNGLSPLTLNEELMKTAQLRAKELPTKYDHTRPDGSSCFTALDEAGIYYWTAGENIAAGYFSPQAVVNGWMNSPGHRANILNSGFTEIGVGYTNPQNSYYGSYWAQMFIG